jgi:excisionase family DNA binding protein
VDDLLTTKQLQELLQVDRITIYRMLHDGRLRGFKVGGQWRFAQRDIDGWLREQRSGTEAADFVPLPGSHQATAQALPLACLQAIQDVCAEALNLAGVTTGLDGVPLTELSNSCEFCSLILSTDNGRRRCQSAWRQTGNGKTHLCHARLHCINSPVTLGGDRIAIVSMCQFSVSQAPGLLASWEAHIPALASELGLERNDLLATSGSIRRVNQASLARFSGLLRRIAETYSEIGEERLSLLNRLQHIAEITKV